MATERDVLLSRRNLLEMSREALVEAVATCRYQKDLPPLVRELRMVLAELESLPDAAASSPEDEIAERRAKRRRKAAGE